MKKKSLLQFVNRIGAFSERHAPELLTGIGITGVISTVALTVMATVKSVKLLDEEKKHRIANNPRDDDENIEGLVKVVDDKHNPYHGHYRLPVRDTIRIIWKPCLPAALTGVASIVCLISANAVSAKRSAALTAAYAISETAFRDYREKVIDIVGDKKEDEIHTAIVQDKIDRTPLPSTSGYNEVIFTDNGDVRCFDAFAGRYFRSSRNRLGAAINNLNRMLLNDGEATLNDFYYFADLENTEIGESLVWCVDKSYDEVNLRFSSHLSPDGLPCLAFSFDTPPSYVY